MAQPREAKKRRQRQKEGERDRARAIRNGAIGAIVAAGIVAVIVLGVFAGSGGGGGSGSGGSSVGALAPDFRIRTTGWSGGQDFVLSQQRGKPVAIYAVAGWCGTCIPETQSLARISADLGEKVSVLIFSADPTDDEQSLLHFKEAAGGGNHAWALDHDGILVGALNIRNLDTTVLIDAQGRVAYRDAVPMREDKLRRELTKLVDAANAGQSSNSKSSAP